jgi:transmembrane sensor
MTADGMRERAGLDDEALRWCLRLSEGLANEREQEELRAWLSVDPERRRRLDAITALWDGIEQEAHAPEMLTMRREALTAMGQASQRRWTWRRPMPWVVIAVAAMLVLAVNVGFLLRDPMTYYKTGVGERRVVALADGSTLSLDADSAVTVRFHRDRRDLTLQRGRAAFKVAKDPLRPFAVSSGAHMVVATGTEFSVEKLATEVRVALLEGRVAVLRTVPQGHAVQLAHVGTTTQAAEQALTPGHELILTNGRALGSLRASAADGGWEAGQLSFANEPLGVAAERVNRYSVGKRIDVGSDVADIRVSGVFNAGDVDAFARAVATVFPVRVRAEGERLRLSASTKGQINSRLGGTNFKKVN